MVIGIDLGTTYSAVSYMNKNGEPEIILNRDEETTTPSVVFVDDKEVVIGKNARKKALQWPQKICRCVKKFMGFRETVLKDKKTEYSPEAISALIIRRLIEDVLIRKEEAIEGIVVTVPTYFNDSKRIATKQAVIGALQAIKENSKEMLERIKTVDFIEIIDEPKAAALYYCHRSNRKQGNILIYDLGGGTFDAALIEIDGNTVKIIAEAEEHAAGGHYFDNKVMEYVIEEIKNNYHINLKEEEYETEREVILIDVENSKKALSEEGVEEVKIAVSCKYRTYDVVLTRERFNEIIDSIVVRTQDAVSYMLEEKGYEIEEIDEVVLVGGSSKIPYVRDGLKEMFGKELCEAIDPDKAVSYGASIYADMLLKERKTDDERTEEHEEILKLEDVCAHSIGLLVINPHTGEKENYVLIEENTPIVAEQEHKFETPYENQTYIKLELTEAEVVISEQNIKIPKGLKRGTEVVIRVVVNSSHLIEVYLKVPSIGFCKEYEVARLQNLSEEEQKELSGLVASKKIY